MQFVPGKISYHSIDFHSCATKHDDALNLLKNLDLELNEQLLQGTGGYGGTFVLIIIFLILLIIVGAGFGYG